MKSYSIVALVALVVAVTAQDTYSGRWNNVDPKPIIDNDRLYKKYETCILGTTTTGCPQDALDLKRVIPEALETVCAKCSPEQQVKIKDTLNYICERRPESFAAILAKLDPGNKFRPAFEAKYGTVTGGC